MESVQTSSSIKWNTKDVLTPLIALSAASDVLGNVLQVLNFGSSVAFIQDLILHGILIYLVGSYFVPFSWAEFKRTSSLRVVLLGILSIITFYSSFQFLHEWIVDVPRAKKNFHVHLSNSLNENLTHKEQNIEYVKALAEMDLINSKGQSDKTHYNRFLRVAKFVREPNVDDNKALDQFRLSLEVSDYIPLFSAMTIAMSHYYLRLGKYSEAALILRDVDRYLDQIDEDAKAHYTYLKMRILYRENGIDAQVKSRIKELNEKDYQNVIGYFQRAVADKYLEQAIASQVGSYSNEVPVRVALFESLQHVSFAVLDSTVMAQANREEIGVLLDKFDAIIESPVESGLKLVVQTNRMHLYAVLDSLHKTHEIFKSSVGSDINDLEGVTEYDKIRLTNSYAWLLLENHFVTGSEIDIELVGNLVQGISNANSRDLDLEVDYMRKLCRLGLCLIDESSSYHLEDVKVEIRSILRENPSLRTSLKDKFEWLLKVEDQKKTSRA